MPRPRSIACVKTATSSLISDNRYPSLPGGDSGDLIVTHTPTSITHPYLTSHHATTLASHLHPLSQASSCALGAAHPPGQTIVPPSLTFVHSHPFEIKLSLPFFRLSNICYAGQHLHDASDQHHRLEGQPRFRNQRNRCCCCAVSRPL
jgi:hypothetical protein